MNDKSDYGVNLLCCYDKVIEILKGGVPVPQTIEIFPTNCCNFSCPHCLFKSTMKENSFMETQLTMALLEELSKKGVKALEISGRGEPLLHPEIENLLKYAVALGFEIGIISNGSMLNTGNLAETISFTCNWIRISLDATCEKTYKSVHGRTADIHQTMSGIRRLTEQVAAQKSNLQVGIKLLVSRLNTSDCRDAFDLAKTLKVNYLQFKMLSVPKELCLTQNQQEVVIKTVEQMIDCSLIDPSIS